MRKLIGILAEEETPSSSAFNAKRYFTNSYYVNAVTENNGIPILLVKSKATEDIIEKLDGLLCQGGADISPSLYGEEKLPICGDTNEEEDLFHIEVIKKAKQKGKKILGVCRGCQIINVAFGGSLYQDQSLFTSFKHNHYDEPTKAFHPIVIQENTILSSIFDNQTIIVNSLHHQSIKKLAPGFKISARAQDGCIEAIERENIVAVQWHPEALRETDKSMDSLFSWLCE